MRERYASFVQKRQRTSQSHRQCLKGLVRKSVTRTHIGKKFRDWNYLFKTAEYTLMGCNVFYYLSRMQLRYRTILITNRTTFLCTKFTFLTMYIEIFSNIFTNHYKTSFLNKIINCKNKYIIKINRWMNFINMHFILSVFLFIQSFLHSTFFAK